MNQPLTYDQLQRQQSDMFGKATVNMVATFVTGFASLALAMLAGRSIGEPTGSLYLLACIPLAGYCIMHFHFANRFLKRHQELRAEVKKRFR